MLGGVGRVRVGLVVVLVVDGPVCVIRVGCVRFEVLFELHGFLREECIIKVNNNLLS